MSFHPLTSLVGALRGGPKPLLPASARSDGAKSTPAKPGTLGPRRVIQVDSETFAFLKEISGQKVNADGRLTLMVKPSEVDRIIRGAPMGRRADGQVVVRVTDTKRSAQLLDHVCATKFDKPAAQAKPGAASAGATPPSAGQAAEPLELLEIARASPKAPLAGHLRIAEDDGPPVMLHGDDGRKEREEAERARNLGVTPSNLEFFEGAAGANARAHEPVDEDPANPFPVNAEGGPDAPEPRLQDDRPAVRQKERRKNVTPSDGNSRELADFRRNRIPVVPEKNDIDPSLLSFLQNPPKTPTP